MTDEILKRVDVLAVKLGTTAQFLWGVLVKQARVEMWQDIAVAAFWLVIATITAVIGLALFRDDNTDNQAAGCFTWFVSLLMLLVVLAYSMSAAGEWANPDYWALKQIMEAAKK